MIHLENARLGGAAHRWWVAAAVFVAALVGGGLAWLLGPDAAGPPNTVASPPNELPALAASAPASLPIAKVDVAVDTNAAEATTCPLQSMHLALGSTPPTLVCLDATRVQQSGSVRSYSAQTSGVNGWMLRVDVAGGSLVKAELSARDGRRYACAESQCVGVVFGRHDTRGVRAVTLRDLRMTPVTSEAEAPNDAAAPAHVTARLSVPSDDQVPGLACTGPSVGIGAADGSLQRFCGQGGAGYDVADDGSRNFRFQNHEGQSLVVSVGSDQQVTHVEFGGYACKGAACTGVTTSSAAPSNDMAERSFFFGRTVLTQSGSTTAPGPAAAKLIVDGTLVMPAQE